VLAETVEHKHCQGESAAYHTMEYYLAIKRRFEILTYIIMWIDPWKYYDERKKPRTKNSDIMRLHDIFKIVKFLETESLLMSARNWREEKVNNDC
jgi:hypothetical protein